MAWFSSLMELGEREEGKWQGGRKVEEEKRDDKLKKKKIGQIQKKNNRNQDQKGTL